jgi:hypothetical protein
MMTILISTKTRDNPGEVSRKVDEEAKRGLRKIKMSGVEPEIGMGKGEMENEARNPLEHSTVPSRLAQKSDSKAPTAVPIHMWATNFLVKFLLNSPRHIDHQLVKLPLTTAIWVKVLQTNLEYDQMS